MTLELSGNSNSQGGQVVDRASQLLTRMESVPFSRWHLKPRIIMGSATFFDAFDALSLAFVLPVLIGMWNLSPAQNWPSYWVWLYRTSDWCYFLWVVSRKARPCI